MIQESNETAQAPFQEKDPPDTQGPRIFLGVVVGLLAIIAVSWFMSGSESHTSDATWGFARPELLDQTVSRDQYLENLALAMDDWAPRVPKDRSELRRQLAQFRGHFDQLELLGHDPLPPDDRIWLQQQLKSWGQALDRRAGDIEILELPFEPIKLQTAQAFRKMSRALRLRSQHDKTESSEASDETREEPGSQ